MYSLQSGSDSPFDSATFDVGSSSSPTLADLDGDGDLDIVIGESDGKLDYFENIGSATNPDYFPRLFANNPFDGIDVGTYSTPTLVDIDSDLDFDLFVGRADGTIAYFENIGSVSSPDFVERVGASNPFDTVVIDRHTRSAFADIDADGDLDAFVGAADGTLSYFKNIGSSTNADYELKTGSDNPLNGVDVDKNSLPNIVDLDGDGDLDIIVGEYDGNLNYFENTGSASNPNFVQQTGTSHPFNGIDVGFLSAPAFADIDGDGDLDAAIGSSNGDIDYLEDTTPPAPTTVEVINGTVKITDGIDDETIFLGESAGIISIADFDHAIVASGDAIQVDNNTVTVSTTLFSSPIEIVATKGTHSIFAPALTYDLNITTGAGNDIFLLGTGDTTVDGGAGTDTLSYLYSVNGVSVSLNSSAFTNVEDITGSAHNDTLIGDQSDNTLRGDAGGDRLVGNSGNDILIAEAGNDTLVGGEGEDILLGGDGNDRMIGGAGADSYDGGAGVDTVIFEATEEEGVALSLATEVIFVGDDAGKLISNVENIVGSNGNDNITGSVDHNKLVGKGGDDYLYGYLGNDTLVGGDGDDELFGGDGNDRMIGGAGADSYDGGSGYDTVIFDSAAAGVHVTLDTNSISGGDDAGKSITGVEMIIATDSDDVLIGDFADNKLVGRGGDDDLHGGHGNDILVGGNGEDNLYGGDGNDRMIGGAGIDSYHGGQGQDTVIFVYDNAGVSLSLASERITAGEDAGQSIIDVETVIGTRYVDNLSGDDLNNRLVGNGGADRLEGRFGNDTLVGGDGDDFMKGQEGNDRLIAGAGNDWLEGGLGADVLVGNEGADQFVISNQAHSLLSAKDRILDLNINEDSILGAKRISAAEIDQLGSLTTFNESSIQMMLTTTVFESESAATFMVGARTYLAINDGVDGFSAGSDAIVEITGYTGSLENLSIERV